MKFWGSIGNTVCRACAAVQLGVCNLSTYPINILDDRDIDIDNDDDDDDDDDDDVFVGSLPYIGVTR
jgi:hypothetical protein